MYTLHGFVTIDNLINNTRKQIAPLGELSTEAETYALDKGIYTLPTIEDVTLFSFRSLQDDVEALVPDYAIKNSIQLIKWLSTKAATGYFTTSKDVFNQAVTAEFRTSLSRIKSGRLISLSDTFILPEWIEFTVLNQPDNKIKLWLSDESFRQQYTFHDIVVVPMIEDVDVFFNAASEVLAMKPDLYLPAIHERVNILRDKSPYTRIRSFNYDWVNPLKKTETKPFPWTVLIYGGINNNIDIIKAAIVDYVLKHSKHTRNEWEKIFPDLFVPTEYIIAPYWTKYSVPNQTIVAGMFSPVVKYKDVIDHFKKVMGNYQEAHVNDYIELSSILYKSASFAVCGHQLNRLADKSFYKQWPQYALMRSVSDDFNRFSPETQNLVTMLNELFKYADESTPDTELPEHLTRVKRGEIYFISRNLDNVQYLITMRWNYTEGVLKA